MEPFVYRAKITRVIDGDTVVATVDLGFHLTAEHRLRLLGINTPELHSKDQAERERAQKSKAFTTNMVEMVTRAGGEWPFLVRTAKSDSFGRWLATIWSANSGEELNKAILSSGNAVVFRG